MKTPSPSHLTSNVGRKRTQETSLIRSTPTPGRNAQMQKIFEEAKASLRLDVAFASSPQGSIASRIPVKHKTGLGTSRGELSASSNTPRGPSEGTPRDWRYSTAPHLLATAEVDVREPFPAISYRTPAEQDYERPPLPRSTSSERRLLNLKSDILCSTRSTGLEQPLSGLGLNTNGHELRNEVNMEAEPHGHDVPLSLSAMAATESARASRGLPSNPAHPPCHKEILRPRLPSSAGCPQTAICETPTRTRRRIAIRTPAGSLQRAKAGRSLQSLRVDSTGSPMPTAEKKSPLSSPTSSLPQPLPHYNYSFSTAAAKITGSSPAPDSRIRDSYRTDTLTPLAIPPRRFQKNGAGANLARGVRRYYTGKEGSRPLKTLRSPEPVRFRSSPPRPVPYLQATPRRKKKRPSQDREHGFKVREDADDVTMIGTEMPEKAEEQCQEDVSTEIRELSPNVMQYRGKVRRKRSRSASFWDADILSEEKSGKSRDLDVGVECLEDEKVQEGESYVLGRSLTQE